MRRAEHSGHGLQVVITGVAAAALIFWAALSLYLPANEDTLRVHLSTLRSSAGEGLTLTRADDERRVTGCFYGVELELLRSDTEKTARSLAWARAEPDLRPRFLEAAGLAQEAARKLHALGVPGAPSESVVAAQATLADIQARVKQMEQEIRP
jgi:hypothetical protein